MFVDEALSVSHFLDPLLYSSWRNDSTFISESVTKTSSDIEYDQTASSKDFVLTPVIRIHTHKP